MNNVNVRKIESRMVAADAIAALAHHEQRMRRRGFTIVETMTAMLCTSLVVTLLAPAIQGARQAARRTQCMNNLRQFGLAFANYHDVFSHLPAGVQITSEGGKTVALSWQVQLLPFIEQGQLAEQFMVAPDVISATGQGLTAHQFPTKVCPSDPHADVIYEQKEGLFAGRWSLTSYLGASGISMAQSETSNETLSERICAEMESIANVQSRAGTFYENSYVPFESITDGTSNTIILGERGTPASGAYGWWTGPGNAQTCPIGWMDVVLTAAGGLHQRGEDEIEAGTHWWSHHPGGAQFVLADGAVRFVSYEVKPDVFLHLVSKSSGEIVDGP